jgi:WD40 repeat protein
VLVWDAQTLEVRSRLVGFKERGTWVADGRGVSALAFGGKDGKLLVTVGMAEGHVLALYDWEQSRMLSFVRTDVPGILCVCMHATKPRFASCGIEHLVFWELTKSRLQKSKPVYGRIATARTMACARYVKTQPNSEDVVLTGSIDGALFVWINGQLMSTVAAHDAPIHDIWISDAAVSSTVVTVGEDSTMWLWSFSLNDNRLTPMERMVMTGVPGVRRKAADGSIMCCCAVACRKGGHVLVGTSCNEIIYAQYSEVSHTISSSQLVMRGHAEGDVTTISCHPIDANLVITAATDGTLRMWDTIQHAQVALLELKRQDPDEHDRGKNGSEDFDEGDSDNWCTCTDLQPAQGDLLAIGMRKGGIFLVGLHTEQEHKFELKCSHKGSKSGRAVACLRFGLSSAESDVKDVLLLAAALIDGTIDIYKLEDQTGAHGTDSTLLMRHIGACRGHGASTGRIQVDWDLQGTTLMASSGAEHLAFWDLRYADGRPRCKERRAVEVRDAQWAGHTCVLSWPLQGVYAHTPEMSIVAAHAARIRPLCVIAAEDGTLSLFHFPSPEPCAPVASIRAHEFGLTCARLVRTEDAVVSGGAVDGCFALWHIEVPSNVREPAHEVHSMDTDACMDTTLRALQQRRAVQDKRSKKMLRQSAEGDVNLGYDADEAFVGSFHPYLSTIRDPQDPMSVPEPDTSPPEDELSYVAPLCIFWSCNCGLL